MITAWHPINQSWPFSRDDPFQVVSDPTTADVIFLQTPHAFPLIDCLNAKLVACACTTKPEFIMPKGRPIAFLTLQGDPILEQITSTVDHTWCLILALNNRLLSANTDVSNGRWDRFSNGRQSMLSDLTLGVVGNGRIGKHVLMVGEAFGMRIKWISDTPSAEWLEDCDIVTLHTSSGIGPILDRRNMAGLTHGCLVINTAQGDAIDSWELIDALDKGDCGGAALDVLSGEFEPGFDLTKHPLYKYAQTHDNLLLTPHIGGSSRDAWAMTQRRIVEKAAEWCKENL